MRRSAFSAFLLLSTLLLTGCNRTGAASVPILAGSPSPSTASALPTAPLSVYIGSLDGTVSALNAGGGAVRWRSRIAGASATSVAAVAAGVVYVGANDAGNHARRLAFLSAFRASDGAVLWHKRLTGASAVAAVSNGVVYLALGGDGPASAQLHEIRALRGEDGSVLWRAPVAGTGPLHASVYDGTLYVTAFGTLLPSPGYYYDATFLYALNASTGTVYWHSQIARTDAVVAVADGQVYLSDSGTDFVCEPRVLHVLGGSDGRERWQTAGSFLDFIGIEQKRIYVADVPEGCSASTYAHGALYALKTADGSSVWQVDNIPFGAGAMLANGALYLSSAPAAGSDLAAYSAQDGSPLWRARGAGGWLWVFGGLLYTSILGEGLDALNLANGSVAWRYQTSDTVLLAMSANDILYAVLSYRITSASWGQEIVALSTSHGKLLWRYQIGTSEDFPLVG